MGRTDSIEAAVGYEQGSEGPGDAGVWRELDVLVVDVQAARAAVAAAQAHEVDVLARAAALVEKRTRERRASGRAFANDLPLREVSAELGAAMRVGDRTVQRRINDAWMLVDRFTATLSSLRAGRIDRAHAAIIAEEGVIIHDDDVRAEYEALVIAVAEVESAGRLREIAHAIAARLDPEAAAEQRAAAAKERGARVHDLTDGLARLIVDLPAPLAHAILDRVTEQARLIRAAEDEAATEAAAVESAMSVSDADVDAEPGEIRTLDQIRTDVIADMLLTGAPTAHAGDPRLAGIGAIRGSVRVTIPLATLAGTSDDPALLDGTGPVDPELVRTLAATSAGWDRVFADGRTGLPVAVDRYRPSSALVKFLAARDERCRFPGCRRPAERCDLDHTIDAAHGGPTSADNLGAFCRRHHTLKHASPWTVRQLSRGRFRWTSPTGRVYDDHSPSTLRFVPRRGRPRVAFDDSAAP